MKRIIFVLSLAAIVAVATPFAAAQKSGKSDKGKPDDQSSPLGPGGRSNQPKSNNPQPKAGPPPARPQPQPQPQPEPRRLPPDQGKSSGGTQDGGNAKGNQGPFRDPRGFSSGGSNEGSKSTGNNNPPGGQVPQGPSKRFNPQPPPDKQPAGKSVNQPVNQPSGGESNKGRQVPRSLGQPADSGNNAKGGEESNKGRQVPRSLGQPADSGNNAKGGDDSNKGRPVPRNIDPPADSGKGNKGGDGDIPRTGRKPDITPPGRGGSFSDGGNAGGGNANAGKKGGSDEEATPKPRRIRSDGPGNPQPLTSGGGQPEAKEAVSAPEHVRRPLGKPSGRGFSNPGSEGPAKVEKATVQQPRSLNKQNNQNNLPVTQAKTVEAPSRFQKRSMQSDAIRDNIAQKEGKSGKPVPIRHAKPVQYEPSGPEGGRVYRGRDYHHEYSHHNHHHSSSSWAIGIGVSGGSSSFAFGYASGGGHSAFGVGYHHHHHPAYHPYWHHPCWYEPVYYAPCYAVVTPVYYSPWYASTVVYDPWAYNSSSFAFGYSSFGGCALSSFSFAYSSSNWGVGFGWTPAPVYTVYTPVYDPYVRSVFVPGYYEIVDEQVWIEGRYEEVVRTPVIEPVVDPLGNTYDAVTEAGSVDYVWTEGHWTTERRRIWREGHFEHYSAF